MPDNSTIKLNKQNSKYCALIRLAEKLILPANTETVFQIKVPKNVKEDDMIIEPNVGLTRQGF